MTTRADTLTAGRTGARPISNTCSPRLSESGALGPTRTQSQEQISVETTLRVDHRGTRRLRAFCTQHVCEGFKLSPFERDVLLLCAGCELDATFAKLCAAAHGDERRSYPTFGLALAALPDPHGTLSVPARRCATGVSSRSARAIISLPVRCGLTNASYISGWLSAHPTRACAACSKPRSFPISFPPSHLDLARQLATLGRSPRPPARFPPCSHRA